MRAPVHNSSLLNCATRLAAWPPAPARPAGQGSLHGPELELPPHSALRSALERMVEELQVSPATAPYHWCIPADALTRWQLLCALLGMLESAAAEGRGPAFRAVLVPASQLGSLPELAWAMSQHRRARFLVLLQAAEALPPASLPDLAAMLSGGRGGGLGADWWWWLVPFWQRFSWAGAQGACG